MALMEAQALIRAGDVAGVGILIGVEELVAMEAVGMEEAVAAAEVPMLGINGQEEGVAVAPVVQVLLIIQVEMEPGKQVGVGESTPGRVIM
jgi:hypothetical protein